MITPARRWWHRLWPGGIRTGAREVAASPITERWVVVDVEASGLDPRSDRLLAMAAFAIHLTGERVRPALVMADSFERILRQPDDPSILINKGNILIHGIGVGAQQGGTDPREVMKDWIGYVGDSPLLAYHSEFDRALIDRTSRTYLGRTVSNPWLDLEPLAAVIHQDPQRRPLDHWLNRYGIGCLIRHQAAADSLATAQLLLRLWSHLPERVRAGGFVTLMDHAEGARFISGRQ